MYVVIFHHWYDYISYCMCASSRLKCMNKTVLTHSGSQQISVATETMAERSVWINTMTHKQTRPDQQQSSNQLLSLSGNDSITWATLWWSKGTSSREIIHPCTLMRGILIPTLDWQWWMRFLGYVEVYWARGKREEECGEWKKAVGWLTKGCVNGPSDSYFKHVFVHWCSTAL